MTMLWYSTLRHENRIARLIEVGESMGRPQTLRLSKGEEILQRDHNGRHIRRWLRRKWHPRCVVPKIPCWPIIAWAERGVVGRGILIDYFGWSETRVPYDPFTTHAISLTDITACLKSQNTELQKGDILLIRSGFISAYSKLEPIARERIATTTSHTFAGLETSEEMLEWIWDKQFSAVGGDSPSFEAWRLFL